MAEYIDKNKILDRLDRLMHIATEPPMDADDKAQWVLLRELHKEFSELPTADVEEVKWIDVNKRLPDEDGRYLVYRKFGIGNYKNIEVIRFENDSTYYKYVWNREITHWRPLPEPPNSAKNGKDIKVPTTDGGKEE